MAKPHSFILNSTIMVVESTSGNLSLLCNLLKVHARTVEVTTTRETALIIAQSDLLPDIILFGISRQKTDGYEVCKQLQESLRSFDIPIILVAEDDLTGEDDLVDEAYGFHAGAVDYITKKTKQTIVLARLNTHLELKMLRAFHQDQASVPENKVFNHSNELMLTQYASIYAMGYLSETRENVTGNRLQRIRHFAKLLAEKLRFHFRFLGHIDDDFIEYLYMTAPLHDIGNVGIPDRILLKPGRVMPNEFEVIMTHTQLGRDVIIQVERDLGVDVPILNFAKNVIYSHHEKWDGSGYPEGLAGDAIPLPARIIAIADVYDALTSRRVYKPSISHKEAVKVILEEKGKHFDPDIVDSFNDIQAEFERIARRFPDSEKDFKKKIDYMEKAISISP